MSLSQLTLINTALIKLGAYKITSLTDGSTESDIANTLYTPIRNALLSIYPWSFATQQIVLSTPSLAPPVADYTYAFDLPTDHLRTLSIGSNGTGQGGIYRQTTGHLETDQPSIILTYIARISEMVQPPFFDLVLINRLAAEFCIPLTENTARAESLYKLSEQELARARITDAMQDTPSKITRFNLISARG